MPGKIKILGFAGSLRKNSYNRALLKNALELLPPDAELEVFDLQDIPLYNQDMENPLPGPVAAFREKIKEADALLFSVAEYNYSISGVLKNAIDWGTRPSNSFDGKLAAVMGASNGNFGTVRAQNHLRQIFLTLNVHALNRPQVLVPQAQNKIDASGKLTDQETRDKIAEMLKALVAWTIKLSK
jgi:chromate reductase, NAD(P)H dehydrogenase (quinone)